MQIHAAKVYITSAYEDSEPIGAFLRNAALDKYKKHTVVNTAEEADIILFIENSRYHSDPFFRKLKNNPLSKKYPHKTFMYNPHDLPWLILPGLYTCFPKQTFDGRKMRASPYLETTNTYISCDLTVIPNFLFSFYGKPQSKPRKEILKLQHERGLIMTSEQDMYAPEKPKDLQLRYAALLTDSKFILCPKGIGTSSSRLFETMQAGRIPVIISDNWVRPAGPKWDEFAIFIPESQVHTIPEVLAREELNWLPKATLARENWEAFFAPDALFTYFVDNLLDLNKQQEIKGSKFNFELGNSFYFTRYFFRKTVIEPVKLLISFIKNNLT